jgi:cellulose synthase operon protein C
MVFRLSISIAIIALLTGATTPARPDWVADARAQFDKGDPAAARAILERGLATNPRNPDLLVLAGNVVRDGYGLLPALPWYDRALAIKPNHEDALFEKAATLGDAGRARDMLAVSRELLIVAPNNPKGFYLQAVLAARAGNWALARGLIYRIGTRLNHVPGMLLLRGAVTLQSGANDEAVASLRPLVDQQPDNAKARRLLGLGLWRVGDLRGAIDILRPLAVQGDRYALTITGRAWEAMGNRAASATDLDGAARAGAILPDAGTVAALDAFLDANPHNPHAIRMAADRAVSRGEWDAAATLYGALSTRIGSRDPTRLVNAGWAEVGREDPDQAVLFGAQAYALAPMNPLSVASYGAFLARSGRQNEAISILETAVAMAPDELRFAQELAAARKSR